jgi:hypothetical protein
MLFRNSLRISVVPELSEAYPPVQPAIKHLPAWHKAMKRVVETEGGADVRTVKTCMPFFDAMTMGFIVPMPVELRLQVADGGRRIAYRYFGTPDPQGYSSPTGPVTAHDDTQTRGYYDGPIIKIASPYFMETPRGYSVLITAPMNKLEGLLPFAGVVSSDKYKNPINFPCRWVGPDGEFVIKFGEPLAQLILIKDNARITNGILTKKQREVASRQRNAVIGARDVYKNKYR